MFDNNKSNKILDRLSQKFATQMPYRGDFVLADFQVIDNDHKEAKVLLQYDPARGVPTREAVAETLIYLYKAADDRPQLIVDLNTIEHFPQHQAIACVVKVPRYRRPIEDAKYLTPLNGTEVRAGTVFLGENMEDTWRVAKSAEGAVFIERLEEDDIDTILRERSKAKGFKTHARTSLTLNRIAASTSAPQYSLGDLVKVTYKGKACTGEVVGVSDSGAQIRFKNGEQATVALASMYALVKASKASTDMQKEKIKEYYRKAYGYDEADLEKLVSDADGDGV